MNSLTNWRKVTIKPLASRFNENSRYAIECAIERVCKRTAVAIVEGDPTVGKLIRILHGGKTYIEALPKEVIKRLKYDARRGRFEVFTPFTFEIALPESVLRKGAK